jgi:hypothetical protein
MKTKLVISALLGITAFAFILSSSTGSKAVNPPPQPYSGNISSEYLIGAMDCGIDRSFSYLNELKLNLWHRYLLLDRLNDNNTRGWDWYLGEQGVDKLYTTNTQYSGVVTNRLEQNLNNTNNPMRTLMERPKIEQLAFGQRSDYQCEMNPENNDLWFYAFNNHDVAGQNGSDYRDNTQYGNGQLVRRCAPDPYYAPEGQGYVIRRLRANVEQCNMMSPIGQLPGDLAYGWYIKPSIRADKYFVDNHADEPICRIDVYNFDGDLIKSTDIRARNFKDENNYYDGKYHEEFNFDIPNGDSTLEFPQSQAINFNPNHGVWAFNSRGTSESDGDDKMDIRVYWYGNCEMWLDYVRVDNDVADGLLGSERCGIYDEWLMEAARSGYVNILAINPAEFELNNLPCLKYVEKKMKEYSNGRFKMVALK